MTDPRWKWYAVTAYYTPCQAQPYTGRECHADALLRVSMADAETGHAVHFVACEGCADYCADAARAYLAVPDAVRDAADAAEGGAPYGPAVTIACDCGRCSYCADAAEGGA